jgi:hypothetical protein
MRSPPAHLCSPDLFGCAHRRWRPALSIFEARLCRNGFFHGVPSIVRRLNCSGNATRRDCARCCRDRIPQRRPFATVIGSSTKMPRCQTNGTVSLPDTAPLANPRDKLVALSGLARRCVLIRVGRSVGSWNWYEYRGGVLVACSSLRNYSLILPECLISQINLISRKRLLSYASPSMIPST